MEIYTHCAHSILVHAARSFIQKIGGAITYMIYPGENVIALLNFIRYKSMKGGHVFLSLSLSLSLSPPPPPPTLEEALTTEHLE